MEINTEDLSAVSNEELYRRLEHRENPEMYKMIIDTLNSRGIASWQILHRLGVTIKHKEQTPDALPE